jgi:hypothetical protein
MRLWPHGQQPRGGELGLADVVGADDDAVLAGHAPRLDGGVADHHHRHAGALQRQQQIPANEPHQQQPLEVAGERERLIDHARLVRRAQHVGLRDAGDFQAEALGGNRVRERLEERAVHRVVQRRADEHEADAAGGGGAALALVAELAADLLHALARLGADLRVVRPRHRDSGGRKVGQLGHLADGHTFARSRSRLGEGGHNYF